MRDGDSARVAPICGSLCMNALRCGGRWRHGEMLGEGHVCSC